MRSAAFQKYPRDEQEQLDVATLKPHTQTLSVDDIRDIVQRAIVEANKKSSRVILNIPAGTSEADVAKEFKKSGERLYDYFKKYCNDPAATAHQCQGRRFSDVAKEQFRNRTLQRERSFQRPL